MYERIDVSDWELFADETAGAEIKHWLRDETSQEWLFKNTTVKNELRYAEDWSEKIAGHLAESMTIPSAKIELASREGHDGIVSLNVRPLEYEMQPGQVWMPAMGIKGFKPGNIKGRPGHSLINIKKSLEGVLPPPGHSFPSTFTGFDAFAGYFVLDAWIANRDRHDENWSVLRPQLPGMKSRLSSSYDLGSSLAFNLSDDEMLDRLNGNRNGILGWAEKGTAYRLECPPGKKPITLVQAAFDAIALCNPDARLYWRTQIDNLDLDQAADIVEQVSEVSDVRRRFIIELLRINAERLQHERPHLS